MDVNIAMKIVYKSNFEILCILYMLVQRDQIACFWMQNISSYSLAMSKGVFYIQYCNILKSNGPYNQMSFQVDKVFNCKTCPKIILSTIASHNCLDLWGLSVIPCGASSMNLLPEPVKSQVTEVNPININWIV